ncbi:SMC family ATPase [Microcoleus sp. FACHB-68]|uniref:exonuclease subunit SbcC n=1 Tax=Microcoleus sp. FACHB-68 TaxID=2692826 RepID=UPI001686649A|nr:SMC family ATPase [Microcoleus sp. FACHB-68]MBD1938224.1 SMC family ATPase [Microcoleus sp. FACHB-68]
MIPHQLILKNFLSYSDATLEFAGLHTACICGPNGAGKSSLLEAIAWSIWGQSRAASEDDIIHMGAKEARVDFTFQNNDQIYRIIRSRQRGHASGLEFQIATGDGFRALTERGVRATQEKIIQHLKLDYETFINSAYLRQGRADEFMLKRPTERKEILAELLKLNHYDELAEQAKDRSRQFKGQIEVLEQSLQSIQAQLQVKPAIAQELAQLEEMIAQLHREQDSDRQQLQQLQAQQHQRQTWQQQQVWHRQQYDQLSSECDRLQQELATTRRRQQELEALLQQQQAIDAGYAQFLQLQAQEEIQVSKWQTHQDIQERRQQVQQQLTQHLSYLGGQISSAKAQLDALLQQEEEIQQTLKQAPEIEAGMAQLQQARDRLAGLDQLQTQVAPLIQRRNSLQTELERAHARMGARLEELYNQAYQLQTQQQHQPQLQQAVIEVANQLEDLEKKRVYQQRVREKGLERRSFMERLQAHQRDYEMKLSEMEQKMLMLQKGAVEQESRGNSAISLMNSQFPPCPLCDRPLDEHHWDLVMEKHQAEQQEILNQLWVVREQLATSEREIQVLRTEYQQLSHELAGYDALRERRGSLQAQLDATTSDRHRLQQLAEEKEKLERSLSTGTYATEVYAELQQLDGKLQQLNYDEKDHALTRGQVDRWRWAEIKQAEIKTATRRQAQIDARKPELQAQIAQLTQDLEQQQTSSEFSQQIAGLEQQLAELGYDRQAHKAVSEARGKAQTWLARYQELLSAREQYPQLSIRTEELTSRLQVRNQDRQGIANQIESINRQLLETPDAGTKIQSLEQQISARRTQLDSRLASLGRLQQQQQHLENLQIQLSEQQQQLQTGLRQQRVYQELAAAFGKNGIQALMIENVLPQLEAETNQILSRLSANQLHIQFVTQRAGKSKKASSKSAGKLIDTLDILIADARGTRPYETYSGGEAFRINFAIRLALARLLAHRSGTALQMLIVDEGFGTQDAEGCDRLISAINAIAPEFACILTVTHMPQFKEAFQARIEVIKTPNGSKISLSV